MANDWLRSLDLENLKPPNTMDSGQGNLKERCPVSETINRPDLKVPLQNSVCQFSSATVSRRLHKTNSLCFLVILVIFVFGCTNQSPNEQTAATPTHLPLSLRPSPDLSDVDKKIFNVNLSEELVLKLSPDLRRLERHLLGIPGQFGQIATVEWEYIGPVEVNLENELERVELGAHNLLDWSWPIETSDRRRIAPTELWREVVGQLQLTDAQFGVLAAKLDADNETLEMELKFEGRASFESQTVGLKSRQRVTWKRDSEQHWNINAWNQESLTLLLTSRPLFVNATSEAIPDPETLRLITQSKHEDLLLQRAGNPDLLVNYNPVFQYFADWQSLFQYPSSSVVDIDSDGWDDVFLLDRVGKSVMLRNCQDGTFEDVSQQLGLSIDQVMANCALFADFDNDGDPDLLLGRALQPSVYFTNENGKFVEDEETNRELFQVRFVSSGSVADVNNDGLLDVYLSTYATRAGSDLGWVQFAVPPQQQAELHARVKNSHSFIDRRGPPNVLLLNKNGKLKRAHVDEPLDQWRNSFQPVWFDYDEDGDLDLYICNDFAPDALLRNDTKRGSYQIQFRDVTEEVIQSGAMGFGMGASVGDYNSDGLLDLYVSNMYSKAGRRIIRQVGNDVHPSIVVSAQGNLLYQNVGGRLQQVAGLNAGDQHVSKVGWSFGGQFADVNNDTKLDLFVPSGFFSPPKSISEEVDL